MANSIKKIQTDVLVIGGGAAACMSAISADDKEASVLMVDKGQVGKSGCSPNAHGGMAAFHKLEHDSWKVHMKDTLLSGGFLNDQRVVETMCKKCRDIPQQLEQFGSVFDRDQDGTYSVRQFGGHSYARSIFSADETGHEMMYGLRQELLRRGIEYLNETMVTKLLLSREGNVAGAVCLDLSSGEIFAIQASAIVIATGGAAGLWPAASERQRGDGHALALRAGAELVDMEFLQYHPTHAWWPYGVRGSVSESVRSEGGRLYNSENERFMERYDPENMELATRDKISVAEFKEIREGRGTEHGGIYLSVTHLPDEVIEKRLRVVFNKYLNYGHDLRKEPMEVRPRPHYSNGGIKINPEAETSVPGLYAAGEVAGGIHGGNRLGSNSLIDLLVFGEIAGRNAARHSKTIKESQVSAKSIEEEEMRILKLMRNDPSTAVSIPELRKRHTELMDEYMGVMRNKEGMEKMAEEVEKTKEEILPNLVLNDKSKRYNFELVDALETHFRMDIEEAATKAALMREESRASHYREDYPKRNDEEWLKNIIIRMEHGMIRLETSPVRTPIVKKEDLPEYFQSDSPWH